MVGASNLRVIKGANSLNFLLSDIYILSKSETEISESYSLLMESLLHVSKALGAMELSNKMTGGSFGGGSPRRSLADNNPPADGGL